MAGKLDRLLEEIKTLTPEELRIVSQAVLRRLAIPLKDPTAYFDDWDDPQADKTYADAW